MQPEHFSNTNTFTCQGVMPKVREKFKTSSNFLKNAFLCCGLLLTSIIKKIVDVDTLSLFPGYKQYKERVIINIDGLLTAHYYLEAIDENKNIECPHCHKIFDKLSKVSSEPITLKDSIPDFYRTKITIRRGKYKCTNCGRIFKKECMLKVPGHYITFRMLNTLYFELKNLHLSINRISKMYSIDKDIVRNVHLYRLYTQYTVPDYSKLQYIGIDEHSIRKGHKYVTIIVDLMTRNIVYVSIGKKKCNVQPFFNKLRELGFDKNIIAYSCDCASGFIAMAEENIPSAKIVLDEFHILRHLFKAFDSVRADVVKVLRLLSELHEKLKISEELRGKRIQKRVEKLAEELLERGKSQAEIDAIFELSRMQNDAEATRCKTQAELINKGRRWLALGYKEFLRRVKVYAADHDKSTAQDIQEAILSCPELVAVLELGDAARSFWHTGGDESDRVLSERTLEEMNAIIESVKQQIKDWIARASLFRNAKMQDAGKFIEKHEKHIVYASSLPFHISNSVVEGINSQAKILQRIRKGRYDEEDYILILHHAFPGREARVA